MSRIYFHTADEEDVEVAGSERAWLGQLTRFFAGGIFNLLSADDKLALMPPDQRRDIERDGSYGIYQRVDERFALMLGGLLEGRFSEGSEIFSTCLNTCLRFGSRPIQLAARIHGQCEIHGWVDTGDGPFIAAVLEQGMKDGVFRKEITMRATSDHAEKTYAQGWEDVVKLLRRVNQPVVTSYSVCESFPNVYVCNEAGVWEPPRDSFGGVSDKAWESWYDLPADRKWELGLEALRKGGTTIGGRWKEEGWDDYYFGDGKTALTFIGYAREVGYERV